jgi:hypothetical protein
MDTVKYRIYCTSTGDTDTATVYINVMELPDNVSDADCYVEPTPMEWGIEEAWRSDQTNVSTYVTPVVGDVDGDGIPEIFAAKFVNYDTFKDIYVFKGNDRNNPITITTVTGGNVVISPLALAKVGNDYVIVTVEWSTGRIYAYNAATGAHLWVSDEKVCADYNVSYPQYHCYSLNFADFDNDGTVELYAGGRIFNAATGVMLAETPAGGNQGKRGYYNANYFEYFTVAADVLGDAKLELLAGTQVYDVNISNKNGVTGNSLTVAAEIAPVAVDDGTVKDGKTIVADINSDGLPDVIFTTTVTATATKSWIVAWDPRTETVIAKGGDITTTTGNLSVPFVGNIDNDAKPEIVQIITNKITGFKLNAANHTFDIAYELVIDDDSGATGITLFDFNQDKKGELVYRDKTHLRILQTDGNTFNNLKTYDNTTSGTYSEYPIVADVDNDGSAEIVVVGGVGVNATSGTLRIYKSGNSAKWAPARKVWNQYAYNVVNVNEDLTIPAVQFNPATVFPGADGLLGTSDDVQPYNNFLQQQTALNKNGLPIWLVPNSVALPPQFEYDAAKDSATIHVAVANIGDAAFRAPFYVTAYKNNAQGTPNYTYAYPNMIMAGDTAIITFGIPDFKANGWVPFDHILIRTNDNGSGSIHQAVCDSAFIAFETGSIIAVDDHVPVLENSVDNQIFVTLNDLKPCSDPDLKVDTITGGGAKHGTVEIVNDSVIVYTPDTDYLGVDSVIYRIYCDPAGDVDTAVVYILVQKPLSAQYTACENAVVTVGFTTINDVAYDWYEDNNGSIGDFIKTKDTIVEHGGTDILGAGKIQRNSLPALQG